MSKAYYDTDHNGYIDQIKLTYNNFINESTVSSEDFTIGMGSDGKAQIGQINSVTVVDNVITLSTAETLEIATYTDDTIAYIAGAFRDIYNQNVRVQNADVMLDKANPILIAASTSDLNWGQVDDVLTVTYSEPIKASTGRGQINGQTAFWTGDLNNALGITVANLPFNMKSQQGTGVGGVVNSDTLEFTVFVSDFTNNNSAIEEYGINPGHQFKTTQRLENGTVRDLANNNVVHSPTNSVTVSQK